MTEKRDDGSEGEDGWKERGGDKCSKKTHTRACAGEMRIGQHVNLNPFRERHKHTGRENKGLSGKEGGCKIFVFLLSPSSPQCVISQLQAAAGKSLCTYPKPLNHILHLTWLFLPPHPLFLFGFLTSSRLSHSSELHCLDPTASTFTHLSTNPLSLSCQFSCQ